MARMIRPMLCATLSLALFLPKAVQAQPIDLPIPAATTDQYPPGVSVGKTPQGPVYVDRAGRTLYGMDMRVLIRWSPNPAQYCQGACAEKWTPLLAPPGAVSNIVFPAGFGEARQRPPGARPNRAPGQLTAPAGFLAPQKAPDWTIIAGPQGPQWVYKGWHMVFTRKGSRPGSTEFDGAENQTWNTLKFIPPLPKVEAPTGIVPQFIDSAYALADAKGRVLFTGHCRHDCGRWVPLAAAMAGRGMGPWTIGHDGDQPQWLYHGQPVFISQEDNPARPPAGGTVMRP